MTDEQKAKYEEAANNHLDFVHYSGDEWVKIKNAFLAGAEHAHSSGWNEALDALDKLFSPVFEIEGRTKAELALKEAFIELQKLRK